MISLIGRRKMMDILESQLHSEMPLRSFAGAFPLQRHTRLQSTNLDDIRSHSSMTFGSLMPSIALEEGNADFEFVHNQVDLARMSLHVLDYQCSKSTVRVEMPPMQPFVLLQFTLSGQAELSQD